MKNSGKIQKYVNYLLDILLGTLAIIIIIFMGQHLWEIASYITKDFDSISFGKVMQEIVSFFMLFEFIMMLVRYIEEGHHIPIRYVILISITAILRQLLVLHGDGMQTLLLSASILLLVLVLYILSIVDKNSDHFDY